MAKRFTDAQKWQDPWFRQLSPTAKVFWLFLLDHVDAAGVWERDDHLFQFLSGIPNEVDVHLDELEGRILTMPDGKILVPKFVKFQQGASLSSNCTYHRHILKLLEKHGLQQDASGLVTLAQGFTKGSLRVTQDLPKGYKRVPEGLANPTSNSKSKSKSKSKSDRGDARGEVVPPELDDPRFHEAWKSYQDMRRQNGWPKLKALSINAKFKEWITWGLEETILALETTVKQGWQGVFEPKAAPKPKDQDRDYANAADF
jgi:hypothetical protein